MNIKMLFMQSNAAQLWAMFHDSVRCSAEYIERALKIRELVCQDTTPQQGHIRTDTCCHRHNTGNIKRYHLEI